MYKVENEENTYKTQKFAFDKDITSLNNQYETLVNNMNDYMRRQTIEGYNIFNKNAVKFKNNYIYIFNEYVKNNLEKSKNDNILLNLINYYNEKLKNIYEKYTDLTIEFRKKVDINNKRKLSMTLNKQCDDVKFNNLEPEYVQSLINKAFVSDGTYDIVRDIESRHLQILDLEQSVTELHELFRDLALLTELNQDKLNIIEVNVNEAKNYVIKGENELIVAEKYNVKSRKCQCVIIIIVLIILALIIGLSSIKYS